MRKRERAMQRFPENFSAVSNHVRPRRRRVPARYYRQIMRERCAQLQTAS
jgi:hypothetical protein